MGRWVEGGFQLPRSEERLSCQRCTSYRCGTRSPCGCLSGGDFTILRLRKKIIATYHTFNYILSEMHIEN